DVLPADRRHRAVAIPPGAQARRPAGARLAIRFPAPVPQVGQRGALLRLRRRPARPGGSAVVARLRPGHRTDARRENRTADLPARAAHGTGISAGKPVNSLVLSGNRRLVLSGNKSSCYQAKKSAAKPRQYWIFSSLNFPNSKY